MLVITIIVIIILAVAVILTLSNNNPIKNAQTAALSNNEATLKEEATLLYTEWYTNKNLGKSVESQAKDYVIPKLTKSYDEEILSRLNITNKYGVKIEEKITNPYDENGWEIAYVCNNGEWEDTPITKGNEAKGEFVAKFYKQKEILDMSTSGLPLENGNAYHLIIEGKGDMPHVLKYESLSASAWAKPALEWFYELETTGSSTKDPGEMLYITEVTICSGITNVPSEFMRKAISLRKITIPYGVTKIGNVAFESCYSLTDIAIPESVTDIGLSAFESCSSLTNITLPENITTIRDQMFLGCSSLTEITIPDNVTNITWDVFNACNSLTKITIPKSVTNIGNSAFISCISLTDVYYKGSKEQWNEIEISEGNEELLSATIHYNSK